jgi:purine-nucleoside phosphorylase
VTTYDDVAEAAETLRGRIGGLPSVAIVLGSGLGDVAGTIRNPVSVGYEEVPHWPASRVAGHEGRVIAGTLRDRTVIALAGRCHVYEGHPPARVAFGIRVLGFLGVPVVVLTNAAGAVNTGFEPGALMVIDDHVNLMGCHPLSGPNDERFGPRFPDMSQVYSPRLRGLADAAACAARIALVHGTYAAVAGPSYETPAEIRYLRTIGIDAVGMSTIPEAIVARHMGIEVLGLSCISNMAAGVRPEPLAHTDVVATTARSAASLSVLLEEIVGQL